MDVLDTYNTIASPITETLLKEKGSKFFGYAYPIEKEDDIKPILEELRANNRGAVHFCYAFQLGTNPVYYRANDDGEPSNTAGMPIYGQIQSFGITNVLVVVVRFFGGIKLGVGGLISAYRTTAQITLAEAEIIEKTINVQFKIIFDYKNMNKVMRVIKEKSIEVVDQKLELNCELLIETRKKNAETIFDIFDTMYEITIKKID